MTALFAGAEVDLPIGRFTMASPPAWLIKRHANKLLQLTTWAELSDADINAMTGLMSDCLALNYPGIAPDVFADIFANLPVGDFVRLWQVMLDLMKKLVSRGRVATPAG